MIVRDLLEKTSCDSVLKMITRHYGFEHIGEIERLFYMLKDNNEETHESNMVIEINIYKDGIEEAVPLEEFDEYDQSLLFDVYAYDVDYNYYSISTVDKLDFLNYKISEDTLKKLSAISILAHCLWEITSYSYE